jgi:hypothetical protein
MGVPAHFLRHLVALLPVRTFRVGLAFADLWQKTTDAHGASRTGSNLIFHFMGQKKMWLQPTAFFLGNSQSISMRPGRFSLTPVRETLQLNCVIGRKN